MTDEEMAEKYRKSLKQKLIDEDEFERLEMFDENDNELMELRETYSANDYAMRVPCIGEHIILSSYEHDHTNDKKKQFSELFIKSLMLLHIIPRIRHTKIFLFNIR